MWLVYIIKLVLYNKRAFEECSVHFFIDNYTKMSRQQQIFGDAARNRYIAVTRITHHWIICNQKTEKISLVDKFLQVTLSSFYFSLMFSNFGYTQNSKYRFFIQKIESFVVVTLIKIVKNKKTRRRYLGICV